MGSIKGQENFITTYECGGGNAFGRACLPVCVPVCSFRTWTSWPRNISFLVRIRESS